MNKKARSLLLSGTGVRGWEAKYTKRKLLQQIGVDTEWKADVTFQFCGGLRKELMKQKQ